MTESAAWGKLRDSLIKTATKLGSGIHVVRIENLVGAGVFDTNICFKGHELWLEGKFVMQLPVKESTRIKVGMSEEQRVFALRRYYAGGVTYLWTKVQMERNLSDSGWYLFVLNNTNLIDDLKEGMLRQDFLKHHFATADDLAMWLLTNK